MRQVPSPKDREGEFIVIFKGDEHDPVFAGTPAKAADAVYESVTEYGADLYCVLEIETIEGGVKRGHDVTEEIYDLCSERECERHTDRFHAGETLESNLEAHLIVADWTFPPEWVTRQWDAWARRHSEIRQAEMSAERTELSQAAE